MTERSAILINCKNSREAVRSLYFLNRAQKKNFTLSSILLRTGIPSRGYLSMVLNGKKTLGKKYFNQVARELGLDGFQSRYLECLTQIDLAKSDAQQSRLRTQLQSLLENLQMTRKPMQERISDYVLLSEVFCSLSLFDKDPTFGQILALFDESKTLRVQSALKELTDLGILELDPKSETYSQTNKKFSWAAGDQVAATVQHLSQTYQEGIHQMSRLFVNEQMSFFNSSIVSTSREHYIKTLVRIREEFFRLESELESEDADTLVRMNIQVYPATETFRG